MSEPDLGRVATCLEEVSAEPYHEMPLPVTKLMSTFRVDAHGLPIEQGRIERPQVARRPQLPPAHILLFWLRRVRHCMLLPKALSGLIFSCAVCCRLVCPGTPAGALQTLY